MIKIEAYIRNNRLDSVMDALDELDVSGYSVVDIRGRGRSKGVTHTYRGSQYTVNLNPRLKVEVLVEDIQAEEVAAEIMKAAQTGEVGDGKIVLIPVKDVIRIRTGERGSVAL
jgi:nitrogen regulatory protein P-II 1